MLSAGIEPARSALEERALSTARAVETCCGIEPHASNLERRLDRQVGTSWCSQPESNRRSRVGNAGCFRNTLAAASASSADRTRVTGLEDQCLTIRPCSPEPHSGIEPEPHRYQR